MRHQYTPGQIRMLVERADRQLGQIVTDSARIEPRSRNIAKSSEAALYETVVSLIRLFREHVPDAAGVATQIAREYASGVDARSGAPTIACVRSIWLIVKGARERYLSAEPERASQKA
jgi:hypothetical protein